MQNGPFFPQNALVIHFSYEYRTFFIHSKIHSIVRQKYSFKEFIHSIVRQKYSFKEFIHSKNNLMIDSFNENINFLEKCRIGHPYLKVTVIPALLRGQKGWPLKLSTFPQALARASFRREAISPIDYFWSNFDK